MVKDAVETINECRYPAHRTALKCNFAQLEDVFDDCMDEAVKSLSEEGINAYLEGASLVCMIGRGFEPVLVYLEEVPQICRHVGEQAAEQIAQSVWKISRTPNGVSILSFLQALPSAARRLQSKQQFDHFIEIVFDFMEATTGSIHGFHTTIPSPALTDLLDNTAVLLGQITLEGLKNWVDYGVHYYSNHPERQKDYFSLQSADSKAILQRERHGTLFADNQRRLNMYLKSLWNEKWDDEVKSRLAAIKAGYSTRMGAAMRHAGHYLGHQQSDKKLLLILTDGEPSDIDTEDASLLIEDTAMAVKELDQAGIYTYCINLDPDADDYVRDIFGNQYSVIDNIERLPEKLPQLFMALTK